MTLNPFPGFSPVHTVLYTPLRKTVFYDVKITSCDPKNTFTILRFRITHLRFHEKPVKGALYRPGFPHPPRVDPSDGGVPEGFCCISRSYGIS
jgi:hypothetical protein